MKDDCKETGTTRGGLSTKAGSTVLNKDNANRGRDLQAQKIASQPKSQWRALWHWWALEGPQWTSLYLKLCGSDIRGSPLPQEGLTSHPASPLQNNNCRCWRMLVFQPGPKASVLLSWPHTACAYKSVSDAVSFQACAKYSMCNTVTSPYEM